MSHCGEAIGAIANCSLGTIAISLASWSASSPLPGDLGQLVRDLASLGTIASAPPPPPTGAAALGAMSPAAGAAALGAMSRAPAAPAGASRPDGNNVEIKLNNNNYNNNNNNKSFAAIMNIANPRTREARTRCSP